MMMLNNLLLFFLLPLIFGVPIDQNGQLYFCCYVVRTGLCNRNDVSLSQCSQVCSNPTFHCTDQPKRNVDFGQYLQPINRARNFQHFSAPPNANSFGNFQNSFAGSFSFRNQRGFPGFPGFPNNFNAFPGFGAASNNGFQQFSTINSPNYFNAQNYGLNQPNVLNTNNVWPYSYVGRAAPAEKLAQAATHLPTEPLSPMDVHTAYAHLNIPVAKKMLDDQIMPTRIIVKSPASPPNSNIQPITAELIKEPTTVPAELQMNVAQNLFGYPKQAHNAAEAANLFTNGESLLNWNKNIKHNALNPKVPNLLSGIQTGLQSGVHPPGSKINSPVPSSSFDKGINIAPLGQSVTESPILLNPVPSVAPALPDIQLPLISQSAVAAPGFVAAAATDNLNQSAFIYPYNQVNYKPQVSLNGSQYQNYLPVFSQAQIDAASPPGTQYPDQITSQTLPIPPPLQNLHPVPQVPQQRFNYGAQLPQYYGPPQQVYPPGYVQASGEIGQEQWINQQLNDNRFSEEAIRLAELQLASSFATSLDGSNNVTQDTSDSNKLAQATAAITSTLIQNPSNFLQGANADTEALSAFWAAPLASQLAAAQRGLGPLADVQKTLFQNLLGDTNQFLEQYYAEGIESLNPAALTPVHQNISIAHETATSSVYKPIPGHGPLPPLKDNDDSFEHHVSFLGKPTSLPSLTPSAPVLPAQHSASVLKNAAPKTTEVIAKFSEGDSNPKLVLGADEEIQEASIDHQALCCFLTTQGLCNTSGEWMLTNCPGTCEPGQCKGLWFANSGQEDLSLQQYPAYGQQHVPGAQSFYQQFPSFQQQSYPQASNSYWNWASGTNSETPQSFWGNQNDYSSYYYPSQLQQQQQQLQQEEQQKVLIEPAVTVPAQIFVSTSAPVSVLPVLEEADQEISGKIKQIENVNKDLHAIDLESEPILTREFFPLTSNSLPSFHVPAVKTVTTAPSSVAPTRVTGPLSNVRSQLTNALLRFDRNGHTIQPPTSSSTVLPTTHRPTPSTTDRPKRLTIPLFKEQPNLFAPNSTSRPCFGWELCADIINGARKRICFCQDESVGRKCGPYHNYADLEGERCHGVENKTK